MKAKDCNLTLEEIKDVIDEYKEHQNEIYTKVNILQRVVKSCQDMNKESLI